MKRKSCLKKEAGGNNLNSLNFNSAVLNKVKMSLLKQFKKALKDSFWYPLTRQAIESIDKIKESTWPEAMELNAFFDKLCSPLLIAQLGFSFLCYGIPVQKVFWFALHPFLID